MAEDYHEVIALWLIKAVLYTGEGEKWLRSLHDLPACLRRIQVLERFVDDEVRLPTVKKHLKEAVGKLERKVKSPRGTLFRNVDLLATPLGLEQIAKDVLTFAICAHTYVEFEDLFRQEVGTQRRLVHILSKVLGHSVQSISQELRGSAPLISSGLIRITVDSSSPFELMDNLPAVMLREHDDENELLANFFRTSPQASLTIGDFPHLSKRVSILGAYLKGATAEKSTGVNILIYGTPGTGKTELVRSVADELSLPLYEVTVEDEDGDMRSGNSRFSAYQLCQKLVGGKKACLVLFDEAEDVFPSNEFFFFFRKSGPAKGWTNRMLEENLTPALWISNKVSQIDPAFLRRFDMAFEVGRPPRSVRKKIVQNYLSDLVDHEELDRLAELDSFTPADVEKTARVLKSINGTDVDRSKAARILVEDKLKIRGERSFVRRKPDTMPFDLSFINSDADLAALVEALKQKPSATICLYGPPGTGKTEFSHYLAEMCDISILVRKGSDLLGKYVGETEKNIAGMFEQAEAERTLLLLDEADSFLQDRRNAHHSWEVTQVNELLVQMENYNGLFICSTNLMDSLDQASTRRFSLKMKFDFMGEVQRREMFNRMLGTMDIRVPKRDEPTLIALRLSAMRFLTPGDFAAVGRKNKLIPIEPSPVALLDALEQEISVKPGLRTRTIGFA
jgi:SpoVK/Ycf46/Vps4 family AAA+-type ATPase